MSELNPYEQLGVTENASFEEIQIAKQNLQAKYQNDSQVLDNIEIAYDIIIMQRLRLRQEGKIKVPEQIRFPEKIKTIEPKKSIAISNPISPKISLWFNDLLDQPSLKNISISGVVFLVLIFVSIFSANVSILPLLLTVGVGTSFFVLYQKQKQFWRSIGITFIAFVIGVCVANILLSILIGSGFNVSLESEKFASLFTFCLLWLVSNFIR
ncbi:CPP1-like family protein [Geminocystis herdmanii]|uniref:CPP1-like family protein n=1 Tax=Geminocystis herdmanii TaxID=669359 RepID=UPI00034ABEC6|nr:CPP1-like family protein [Geminocystis herdmanii]